jgi:putative phage-type endonuclease
MTSLTNKQLAERATGLGGSDAWAYCGKDPRKTPMDLWMEKTGKLPVAPAREREPNSRPGWGSRLEPVVRDWLSEELGRKIHHNPKKLYRSDTIPFLIGHLDGITESPMEGVEIKCADKFMADEFGERGTDQIPIRYVLQVMHYMIVTRLPRFHVGALVGGNDARHYVVEYNEDLAQMIIDQATKFWHYVETDTPPDPVSLEDADKRWPASFGRTVIANEEILKAITDLKQARARQGLAEKEGDEIEVELKSYMGDAGGLIDQHHHLLATWRSQTSNRFDQKAFAAAHPELLAQFRSIAEFRVFRLR